jgi:hypothetical protein
MSSSRWRRGVGLEEGDFAGLVRLFFVCRYRSQGRTVQVRYVIIVYTVKESIP